MADEANKGTETPRDPAEVQMDSAAAVERSEAPIEGLIAFFEHPNDTLEAATKCRDEGFETWDVLTPFPIHGMDEAMGLGRSWMPWVTFALAMTGLATAAFIEFGTMAFDWAVTVGGKPHAAWPSFIPIMFELMVLFAGVGSAAVMIKAVGLPKFKRRILDPRISRDRFVIWISSDDGKFDREGTREFLKSLEPLEVREVASS